MKQISLTPDFSISQVVHGQMRINKRIRPMAYSPLAWGKLVYPDCEKSHRVVTELDRVAREIGIDGIDKIIFAWIAQYPAGIVPINGITPQNSIFFS